MIILPGLLWLLESPFLWVVTIILLSVYMLLEMVFIIHFSPWTRDNHRVNYGSTEHKHHKDWLTTRISNHIVRHFGLPYRSSWSPLANRECTQCASNHQPVRQPLRTVHCKYCNVCRIGFDHHCVALNTCIDESNYLAFVSVILWATVWIGLVNLTIIFWLFFGVQWQRDWTITNEVPDIVNVVVDVLFGGVTTYDYVMATFLPYFVALFTIANVVVNLLLYQLTAYHVGNVMHGCNTVEKRRIQRFEEDGNLSREALVKKAVFAYSVISQLSKETLRDVGINDIHLKVLQKLHGRDQNASIDTCCTPSFPAFVSVKSQFPQLHLNKNFYDHLVPFSFVGLMKNLAYQTAPLDEDLSHINMARYAIVTLLCVLIPGLWYRIRRARLGRHNNQTKTWALARMYWSIIPRDNLSSWDDYVIVAETVTSAYKLLQQYFFRIVKQKQLLMSKEALNIEDPQKSLNLVCKSFEVFTGAIPDENKKKL